MKKTIILSVVMLFVIALTTNAQRYSINKLKYDSQLYIPQMGDPYNPALSGVCSFLVPGLGQMICGETGRGLAFFGGYVACEFVFIGGYVSLMGNALNYGESPSPRGIGAMILGVSGMAAVGIWSIVDAVKVAKVNNMYVQDLRRTSSLSLEVAPYVAQISISNRVTTPVGLTLRVKF